MCERLDLTHILDKIKLKFYDYTNVLMMCYIIVCLYQNTVKNVINLFNKYDACVGDVTDTNVILASVGVLIYVGLNVLASYDCMYLCIPFALVLSLLSFCL